MSNIKINEMYGPVIQGEGPDLGKAALFIRLHSCPVQCPGCDTHYTWDGTEKGENQEVTSILDYYQEQRKQYPQVGVVLTGGEPLIHFRSHQLIRVCESIFQSTWIGLETSGVHGVKPLSGMEQSMLARFLFAFTTVCVSPKITPCLMGQLPISSLTGNLPFLVEHATRRPPGSLVFKFVVRDGADIDAVLAADAALLIRKWGIPIYLMPYGQDREEIFRTCERLVPIAAKEGLTITPRLHSIMYGAERGR